MRLWRFAKGLLVFFIVAFHLVALAIRNPLDLWYKPIRAWIEDNGHWQRWGEDFQLADRFTWKYTNLVGCEQCWCMFSPPVARRAPFLGVRFDFTDGSSELVRSRQEPEPTSFFRVGGWQQRKLEDYLLYPPDNLENNPERPLWEGYARAHLRRWRERNPDDPREVERVVFLRRRIHFPRPEAKPEYDPPTEAEIASFDAEGRLTP
jgi:hypothetical protein